MIDSPVGAEIVVEGKRYINFGGSSYLGMASHPKVLEAGCATLRESGAGYQFPRAHGIATRGHAAAEAQAATFFGAEAALYLPNGYSFGLVAIAALREQFNRIFFDELAHHSLSEAIAAAGLPSHAFRHLDAEDLQEKLAHHLRANEQPLIVTDGMYSTFGEIAPLDQLIRVMTPYGGRLLVDESHSFGVLGETGRGVCEHFGISRATLLSGGSTGKALGVLGGLIPATKMQFAALCSAPASRSAAAGLPAAAAMCAESLKYIHEHPQLLQRLRSNVSFLKQEMRKLGLAVGDTVAPVASFIPDSGQSMRGLQERLMSEGIFVFHSTYIGAGPSGVIRCGIFADHTNEHLERLLDALRRLL